MRLISLFCLWVASGLVFAQNCPEFNSEGFCWPTGTSKYRVSIEHLEHGTNHGGRYFKNEYHIGVDIAASEGSNVWPIADGKVIHHSSRQPTYGCFGGSGWTCGNTENYALLVLHETKDGQKFVALYGHLLLKDIPKIGTQVTPSKPIGKIGDWSGGDHLHFSIWSNTENIPSGPYGREEYAPTNSNPTAPWPNAYGQTEPISFLQSETPKEQENIVQEGGTYAFNCAKKQNGKYIAWFPRTEYCDDDRVSTRYRVSSCSSPTALDSYQKSDCPLACYP